TAPSGLPPRSPAPASGPTSTAARSPAPSATSPPTGTAKPETQELPMTNADATAERFAALPEGCLHRGVLPGNRMTTPAARPVIKWAGGKPYLLARIKELLRDFPCADYDYCEPMVGGGAVYFALAHRFNSARIADSNPELMNLYRVIQTDVDALVRELQNG